MDKLVVELEQDHSQELPVVLDHFQEHLLEVEEVVEHFLEQDLLLEEEDLVWGQQQG